MTENKRFTSQRTEDYNYSDILDNGKWVGICHVDCEDDFVDKFNELNDENIELHIQNDFLKDENQHMRDLVNENEQLKQELKVYRKVASCGNCRYHNYDWFDDGDEFEVCDKGNDVTEGICEDWEEL